jgi:hypothetical protein
MEANKIMGVIDRFSAQGAIPRLHHNPCNKLHLEILGATQMQFFRMAHHPESNLVGRQTRNTWLAEQ